MRLYMMDFYDLDCSMIAEKKRKMYEAQLKFPDGSSCTALMKSHTFAEATVLKIIKDQPSYDKFVADHEEFLFSQARKRHRIDMLYFFAKSALYLVLLLILVYCFLVEPGILIVFFLVSAIYKGYLLPKLILLISDKHLSLLVHHQKDRPL